MELTRERGRGLYEFESLMLAPSDWLRFLSLYTISVSKSQSYHPISPSIYHLHSCAIPERYWAPTQTLTATRKWVSVSKTSHDAYWNSSAYLPLGFSLLVKTSEKNFIWFEMKLMTTKYKDARSSSVCLMFDLETWQTEMSWLWRAVHWMRLLNLLNVQETRVGLLLRKLQIFSTELLLKTQTLTCW